jgi:hypothetical protein
MVIVNVVTALLNLIKHSTNRFRVIKGCTQDRQNLYLRSYAFLFKESRLKTVMFDFSYKAFI